MVDFANMIGRAVGQAVNNVVQGAMRPDPRGPSGQFGGAAKPPQGYATPQGNLGEQVAKLPETFSLSQSRSLSSLVEHSLAALGFMDKRKADGNLDASSLEAMNKFRAQHSQPPLKSFDEFNREDMGQLLVDLSQNPNASKSQVLSQAVKLIENGLGELPQQSSTSGWSINKNEPALESRPPKMEP